MDSVAFTIFGLDIKWYGVIIAGAVFLGVILALKEVKRLGLSQDDFLDLLLLAIPAAIIGARIYYVIFDWSDYYDSLFKIFNTRGGGLAIHGGLIAAVIVAILFTRKRNMDFWKVADIAAPSIVLGQAIGRWGNYFNQEAHGTPTDLPWGILIDGVKVHPTFLYESIGDFLIFLFLVWYRKKAKASGEVFLLYVILYSSLRFFVEGLRTDSLMFGNIRVAQLISILSIVIGIYLFSIRRRKHKKKF